MKIMFDAQYRYFGRHAYRAYLLTSYFEKDKKSKLFERNIDLLINAPLIGFLYGRRADVNNDKKPDTDEVYKQNVMGDRVMMSAEDLMINYRLIMLLDEENEPDLTNRINKAFRESGKNEKDEERFYSYFRGGIDVLYEKLIEGASTPDDYINRLYDFLTEFDSRFNENVSSEHILELSNR